MDKQAVSSVFKGISLPEKGVYDVVFSLGCNCGCAEYLRKYGLRASAGPFDWVLAPSAQAPFHILLEDLRPLLQLDDLKEINGKAGNRIVVSGRSGYTLFHDFWQDAPLQAQLPQVCAKYARRAERFLDALCKGKRVLLVWYGETGFTLSDEEIVRFSGAVRKKYGQNTDFLVLQYEPGLSAAAYQRLADGAVKAAFPCGEREEGNLLWDRRRVGPVFSSIKCRSVRSSRWTGRLRALAVRAASTFIWNRQKRHHFIDVYLNGK